MPDSSPTRAEIGEADRRVTAPYEARGPLLVAGVTAAPAPTASPGPDWE
jgi:hypothetical protein